MLLAFAFIAAFAPAQAQAMELGGGLPGPSQENASTGVEAAGWLGVRYARMIVERGDLSGAFAWSETRGFVETAIANEMKPYLTLSGEGSPNPETFARWCGEVATAFRGRVFDYGVWNEPNHDPTNARGVEIEALDYRALYVDCRKAIKDEDSTANVYFGELEAGGAGVCAYLDEALPTGSARIETEGVAIHPYQYTTDPTVAVTGDPCRGIGRLPAWTSKLAGMTARIATESGQAAPLLISEFGYCTDRTLPDPDNPYTTESARAACAPERNARREIIDTHVIDEATRRTYIAAAYRWAADNGVRLFVYHTILKRWTGDWLGNRNTVLWETGLVENSPAVANWPATLTYTPTASALRTAAGTVEPTASIGLATNLAATAATLNGTVAPKGWRTTYWFEYGLTTAYGSSTTSQTVAGDAGPTPASAVIGGLREDTTYHVQLVVKNRTGVTRSGDATFTTAPASDFVETMFGNAGGVWRWASYSMAGASQQPPIAGNPDSVIHAGQIRLYSRSTTGHLIETVTDWLGGHAWNAYDLTTAAGGVTIAGDPDVAIVNASPRVYANRSDGHLVEFVYGSGWLAYDATLAAGAPATVGKPDVVIINGLPRIYARSTTGSLIEFVWSGANGRSWEWYDLTSAAGAPRLAGDPSAIVLDGTPRVYARATNGHLVEIAGDGAAGRTWNWYDITGITQVPSIAGDPLVVSFDARTPRVYAVTQDGHLHESIRYPSTWGDSDLSIASSAPPLAASRPAFLLIAGSPHVYTRSSGNHLIETLFESTGWRSYDLNTAATEASVSGNLTAVYFGDGPRVYYRGLFH